MNPVLAILLALLIATFAIGTIVVYAADDPKKRRRRVVISGGFATFFGCLAIAFALGGDPALNGIITVLIVVLVAALWVIGYALDPRGRSGGW